MRKPVGVGGAIRKGAGSIGTCVATTNGHGGRRRALGTEVPQSVLWH